MWQGHQAHGAASVYAVTEAGPCHASPLRPSDVDRGGNCCDGNADATEASHAVTRQPQGTARKQRVFERVRDAILDDISAERLKPGDRLPSERALAENFDIGRHAVREALRTLEMSGVLRFSNGASGGAFVREKSGDGVGKSIRDMIVLGRMPLEDLMAVRVNLLVQAAELAAERADDADFAAIDANIAETQRCLALDDPVATITPLVDFNRALGRASHNLVLSMLIDSVAEIVADFLKVYQLRSEIELVAPRVAIVAALRARDAGEAARILRSHYEQTTRFVLARIGMSQPDDA